MNTPKIIVQLTDYGTVVAIVNLDAPLSTNEQDRLVGKVSEFFEGDKQFIYLEYPIVIEDLRTDKPS